MGNEIVRNELFMQNNCTFAYYDTSAAIFIAVCRRDIGDVNCTLYKNYSVIVGMFLLFISVHHRCNEHNQTASCTRQL